MRIAYSLEDLARPEIQDLLGSSTAVGVTIGNFDGFHLGHQALFERLDHRLSVIARVQNLRPTRVLFTFVPHPRNYFKQVSRTERSANPEYFSITPLRKKLALAREQGFDLVVVAHFNRDFARLSPTDFIERYLVGGLGTQLVVVGYDWSFGKDRAGTTDFLFREGQAHGFQVAIVPPVLSGETRVSSSVVRSALSDGDLSLLETLLGRPFSILAKVVHGEKRGRTIGFPTANLRLHRQLTPPDGVYAVRATLRGVRYDGVANLGQRPTFDGVGRSLEVHLLQSPPSDCYGEYLDVTFIERVRDEKKFSGIEELRVQIESDIVEARAILRTQTE